MVVINAEINGKELTFLVDTGIEKTILFNLKFSDSIKLNKVKEIQLRGLGTGVPINALISDNNLFRFNGIIDPNHRVYIILDDLFDLSSKMGIDIHGIIGGDLFKDFVVKINYATEKITFYNQDTYNYRNCKKCETFPLDFYDGKPYIDVFVENHLGDLFKVKLLIDSGGGDALWLFDRSHQNIVISDKYFDDYLGKGLNGSIFGKRSKISKLKIGKFVFENASVSYPDSIAIVAAQKNKQRNGSLGAEILKRFHVIFDYKKRTITLKKNNKYFNSPFLYNKSGLELVYGGEMLIKEKRTNSNPLGVANSMDRNIFEIMYSYGLAYKPSFQISFVREGSPARLAGLLVGDIILEINGAPSYEKEMSEIIQILSQKENKRIKLLVDRDGNHLRYQFYLKDMF
jgi:PDZ domain-containing protein/aspartyl protease